MFSIQQLLNNEHYSPIITSFFLVLLLTILTSYCDYPDYETCKQSFKCGLLEDDLSYPFWAEGVRPKFCGHDGFELKCEEGQYPFFAYGAQALRQVKVNLSSYWLTLKREDYNRSGICLLRTTTLEGTPFQYMIQDGLENITIFYNCSPGMMEKMSHNFLCLDDGGGGFYESEDYLKNSRLDLTQCGVRVAVPVPKEVVHELELGASSSAEVTLMEAIIEEGFNVTYGGYDVKAFTYCSSCVASGGGWATDLKDASNIVCLCPEGPEYFPSTCHIRKSVHPNLSLYHRCQVA